MLEPRVAIVAFLFLIVCIYLFFASYAMNRRKVPVSLQFALFMLSNAVYAGGYALELSNGSLPGILTAIRFEYIGIVLNPTFLLLFALRFATDANTSKAVVAGVFVLPVVALAIVWTNDLHHLHYARAWVETSGPFPVIGFERGPLYWGVAAMIWLYIGAGSALIVGSAVKADRTHRRQAIAGVAGVSIPLVVNVPYLLGLIPWGLEPVPFAMAGTAVCLFIMVFRFGLFDLVPIARGEAIDALAEGLIVFDLEGAPLDSNPAARSMLGPFDLLKPLPASNPAFGELRALATQGKGRAELEAESDEGVHRILSAEAFPVQDRKGDTVGCSVLIRDVTENRALLQRLESKSIELERALTELRSLNTGLEARVKEQVDRLERAIKLKRYLPPALVEDVLEGRKRLEPSFERLKTTIFFSDVRGFTEATDALEPERLSHLLNEYLSAMSDIAFRLGGTIDKFRGDGMMVLFGAPEPMEPADSARRCALMAAEMCRATARLRAEWDDKGYGWEIGVRMGINTGYATVGEFGSEDRMDFTAIGAEVNFAHRLESASEVGEITLSHSTYTLLKDAFPCSPRGEVTFKGFARPERTYALLWREIPAG